MTPTESNRIVRQQVKASAGEVVGALLAVGLVLAFRAIRRGGGDQ